MFRFRVLNVDLKKSFSWQVVRKMEKGYKMQMWSQILSLRFIPATVFLPLPSPYFPYSRVAPPWQQLALILIAQNKTSVKKNSLPVVPQAYGTTHTPSLACLHANSAPKSHPLNSGLCGPLFVQSGGISSSRDTRGPGLDTEHCKTCLSR